MESDKKSRTKLLAIIVGILVAIAIGLVINTALSDNGPRTTSLTFTAVANKTVLDQLQDHAEVDVRTGVDGAYPHSIDGTETTEEGYWTYYVDGKISNVPAADLTTKGGELIKWKFEEFE